MLAVWKRKKKNFCLNHRTTTISSEIEWSMFLLSWNNISPRYTRRKTISIWLSRFNFSWSIFLTRHSDVSPEVFRPIVDGILRKIYENLNWPPNRMLFLLETWLKFNVTVAGRFSQVHPSTLSFRLQIVERSCFCTRFPYAMLTYVYGCAFVCVYHGMDCRQSRDSYAWIKKQRSEPSICYRSILFN